MMLTVKGMDPPGLIQKSETSRDCCEFLPALGLSWGCERSPCARQVACPHSCGAREKGTALSAAAALLGRGRTPAVSLSRCGQTIISFHWGQTGAQMG